jgi:hypothetical protein
MMLALAAAPGAADEQDQQVDRDGDDREVRRRPVKLGQMRHAGSLAGTG